MLIRTEYLNKLIDYKDTEFIKVISGVRRSGKSFLLKMYKDYLDSLGLEHQIVFINFEHPDTFGIRTGSALYEHLQSIVKKNVKLYFLFDEIQEVEGWQSLINGLRVAYDCDIYITGSNAHLLSGEMATYLTGRYVELHVYPFSFSEIVEINNATTDREKQELFDSYTKYGGFPAVVSLNNEAIKRDVLKGIYNSILLKDVALRGSISSGTTLQKLAVYLMDNIGNQVSINKITNYLKSSGSKVSFDTIDKYISLLEGSFILYKAVRYDIRGKERLKTLGKYYVVDTGLRNSVLERQNTNMGSQIENIVYLKLIQSGYEVFVGKYDDYEIDFVCFKDGLTKYVQVAYELPANSNRELHNLLLVKENFEKLIITMNYMDVGVQSGVNIIHLMDFLLSDF